MLRAFFELLKFGFVAIIFICIALAALRASDKRAAADLSKATALSSEQYAKEKAYYDRKTWGAPIPGTEVLEVVEGWTYESDGNYSYLRGRLKNVGDKTITYWKLVGKFYSKKGEMLDQDYTNSNLDIEPGDSNSFEIMHRSPKGATSAKIEVVEVKIR